MSMNFLGPISRREARTHCLQWHYSGIFPPHCMVNLGCEDEKGMAGVALWGWGVRPLHTIQKLFPSLGTSDYWELNRLCLRDDCPRNSESWFLAQCATWFSKNQPERKILISWADGIRGKPGYVYQAAGWLYGGFIETEIYLDADNNPVHPRLLITRYGSRSKEQTDALGLRKVWGKQFMYARFLCGHGERKRLLRESPNKWTQDYPKHADLEWRVQAGEVSRVTRDAPSIQRAVRACPPAPFQQQELFA